MRKVTRLFKSRTSGAWYKTERHRNGDITCYCPSFIYRRTCRHVEQAKHWKH